MKNKIILQLITFSLSLLSVYSSNSCFCKRGHIYDLKNNKCIPNTLPPDDPKAVEGCKAYYFDNSNQLICDYCLPNYYYDYKSDIPKCIKTNLVGCRSVELDTQQHQKQEEKTILKIRRILDSDDNNQNFKCIGCQKDYHFDSQNICQPNPKQGENNYVQNCTTYQISSKNETICIDCDKGLYVKNNKCIQDPKDRPNCQQFYYNPSTNQTECKSCKSKFYLQNSNKTCQPYPYISGCTDFNLNKTTNLPYCTKCSEKEGLALDYNNQKCIEIKNLVAHCTKGNFQNNKFSCSWCEQGYYESGNICVENPTDSDPKYIPNCEGYKPEQNDLICYKCKQNYVQDYSDYKKCIKVQKIVENCDDYDISSQNSQATCKSCLTGYTSFQKSNITQCNKCPNTPIQNTHQQILLVGILLQIIILLLLSFI